MGGKTSAASKNKYNAANYDRIAILPQKAEGVQIRAAAAAAGQSLQAYILDAVRQRMGTDHSDNKD